MAGMRRHRSAYLAPNDGWFRVTDGYARHCDRLARVLLVQRSWSHGKIWRICALLSTKTNNLLVIRTKKTAVKET